MKNLYLSLIIICFGGATTAQVNYADIYDTHFNSHAARYFPGQLGNNFNNFDIDFINLYAWAGNTTLSSNQLQGVVFGNQLSESQLNEIVSHLKNKNKFFAGADLQLFNMAWKIRSKKTKNEIVSMQAGIVDRLMANLQLSRNILSLAFQGNEQFAGQTVSLGTVKVNAMYMRQVNCGISKPFHLQAMGHSLDIRPGITAKFLTGIADLYTPKGEGSLYTDPEGKYLNFDYNYQLNAALPKSPAAIGGGTGMGAAADMGINLTMDDFLSFDMAVIDMGGVRFTNNVTNYSNKGSYQYNGINASLFNNGSSIGYGFNPNALNPDVTHQAYTSPIGARMMVRAEYRLGKSKKAAPKGVTPYFQHHFFFTYVQGLQNVYSATTTPNFSLGYMYSYRNIFNTGMAMGFLGYNKLGMGPFVSVKGGPFMFGVGSNNLMAIIAPKFGTGADAYMNMAFSF